ncbi:unnamed protein product [Schistosoma margrebowiei]|uniref:Uncharacterized protein n=1 Tax=Schistosoma margrebowiei TaxID=48269 RepID=A0AA84Z5Y8_9TREM|nr:unnamed protein product [Schistosoma margrebowiei]
MLDIFFGWPRVNNGDVDLKLLEERLGFLICELSVKCEGLAIHPFLLALPVTVATSYSFALPAATPPNTIVFAKGRVRVKHMLLAGIPLNIVGGLAAVAAVSSYTMPIFGLNTVPSWSKSVTNTTNT